MRVVIEGVIAEVLPESEVSWKLQIDTELCKVWSRDQGFEVAPDLPVAQSEHYFRDMDDPLELLAAYEDDRFTWDRGSYETFEFMPDYESENILCVRTVMSKQIALLDSQREFVEKRIKFTSSQLDGGSFAHESTEHYLWVASLPDDL